MLLAVVVVVAALTIADAALCGEAGAGAIQLVRMEGGTDEELRRELLDALRKELWRHGLPDARVSVTGAKLPPIDPASASALREWRLLGQEREAETIALIECRLYADNVSLGLWVITVSNGEHHSARLESKRSAAAETLGQLIARAAKELVPAPAAIRAAAEDKLERRYRSAKRRRNVGAGLLGLGVLFGVPTVIGLVMASNGSNAGDDSGAFVLASAPGIVLLSVGCLTTVALITAGTVILISGLRRMDRYGPNEDADAGLRPRFAGLSPVLDGDGRPSGLGLRLVF